MSVPRRRAVRLALFFVMSLAAGWTTAGITDDALAGGALARHHAAGRAPGRRRPAAPGGPGRGRGERRGERGGGALGAPGAPQDHARGDQRQASRGLKPGPVAPSHSRVWSTMPFHSEIRWPAWVSTTAWTASGGRAAARNARVDGNDPRSECGVPTQTATGGGALCAGATRSYRRARGSPGPNARQPPNSGRK